MRDATGIALLPVWKLERNAFTVVIVAAETRLRAVHVLMTMSNYFADLAPEELKRVNDTFSKGKARILA